MRRLKLPPPNLSGLCQCGCGQATAVARCGNSAKGWVKGEHRRFVSGHNSRLRGCGPDHFNWKGGRIKTNGYIMLNLPAHPHANSKGYVKNARVISENALGKSMPEGIEVHHVNGDKADDQHANLVICENHKYHALLHRRTRAFSACSDANWRKCVRCKKYDAPLNMSRHSRGCVVHRRCSREYNRRRRQGIVPYQLETRSK